MEFRWNDWNWNHVQEHGVTPDEAEGVVQRAKPPYPERRGDDKWLVHGSGHGGRFLQVIYIEDADGCIFIIHARPLNEKEKQRYKRRIRT